jgi:hypothetical protein
MRQRGESVTADADGRPYLLLLTPKIGLVRNALWSILLISVPVFGVLIFFGLTNGTWTIAVVGLVFCLLLGLIAYLLYRATYIGITDTAIDERGFWGARSSILRSEIASVVLANTYGLGSTEVVAQLVVRDAGGSRILRMRGSFWSVEAMRSAIAVIDVSPVVPPEPLSAKEFFARFPGSAYWFERRPILAIVGLIGMLLVGAGIIFAIMRIAGLPVIGF